MNEDIKITGRPIEGTGFALAGQSEAGSGIDTAWNFYRHFFMNQNLACAATFGAGIGNDLTLAPTGGAGGPYREKALTSGDLAGSLAVPTVFWIRPWLTGAAFALWTSCCLFKVNFCFRPKCCLHETKTHVVAKIRAPLGPALGSTGSGKPKKILKNPPET